MSVLDHLWTVPGVYWGLGQGPNSEFVSRVAVVSHEDGSVTIDYEAWSEAEGLQHAEAMVLARSTDDPDHVVLTATSDGGDDTMTFREGEAGVFGSTGRDRVGLVLVPSAGRLAFSWWWPDENGVLSQQSRAELRQLRPIVPAPPNPFGNGDTAVGDLDGVAGEPAADEPDGATLAPGPHDDSAKTEDRAGARAVVATVPEQSTSSRGVAEPEAARPEVPDVPWPGIVVLAGNGTGVVAQRLAERLSRAAVVRTDLFDRAVRGSEPVHADPALRHRIAVAVTHGYACSGHPVILHGGSGRADQVALADELVAAGLEPVRLVDVADGEDYGEVARRLIDGD